MNLSKKWLSEFVNVQDIDSREFAEKMTMSGSKVEGFTSEDEIIDKVVVGKILSIEKHPNADKLVVCQVDVGDKNPIQIVTAAKNIEVGNKVPVATHGSTLANGERIYKGKLRGVESFGMFCSIKELGLTLNDFPYAVEDGIFIIEEDCEVGQDICSAIGLNDTKFEFEITSNRPDCFSVIGLAREASATFNKEIKLHSPVVKGGHGDCREILNVKVEEKELCPIYCAKIVKNVRVKPSPRWMRERLRAMGVRPINNIVDITNYVMLEYGQPMHAFDIRFIKGNKINVRLAKDGEVITTLDGIKRKLKNNQLVIADENKPIAIAGVMGGEYSGIMDDTNMIVFESANFKASSVRLTAKAHGMRTDASSRYEKGLDVNNCIPALERACELVELLDAGDVLDSMIVDDNSNKSCKKIPLEVDWINNFLNTKLTEAEMKDILLKIGCEFENKNILIPSFRPDLEHKADIAEEIARFYGYNNIVSTSIKGASQGKYSKRQKFDKVLSETLIALGLNEIMTYSFVSPKVYDKILMPEGSALRHSVKISNPLGEDTSIMRTTAIPSMLEALSRNYNNKNEDVSLFEIAKEYIPTEKGKLPEEKNVLVAGLYGKDKDFFTAKGILEDLFYTLSINSYDVESENNYFCFHPGRCAKFLKGNDFLGVVGEIHPKAAENYDFDTRVYIIYVDCDVLYKNYKTEKSFKPLPKFPSVSRDISVICDENLPVLKLQKIIEKCCSKFLEKVTLFDVYKGEQIQKGKKSVAFNIVLRSNEATLKEEQVSVLIDKTIKELNKNGAELR